MEVKKEGILLSSFRTIQLSLPSHFTFSDVNQRVSERDGGWGGVTRAGVTSRESRGPGPAHQSGRADQRENIVTTEKISREKYMRMSVNNDAVIIGE